MINQIDEPSKFFINKNLNKKDDLNTNLFRQTLNEVFDRSGVSKQENIFPASSLKEIPSEKWPVDDRNIRLENKTNRLIKMLGNYSLQLENNEMSLKRIEPFMKEIKNSAGKLLKETAISTNADAKLKNIAEQCAFTANNEYLKFQRGDYL